MNEEILQSFEEDTLIFDAERFNALPYEEQIGFVLRKASFIRKHILRDDPINKIEN